MDPLTAALNAYTASLNAWMLWFGAASPTQQQALVQEFIDGQKLWFGLFAWLKPKETP